MDDLLAAEEQLELAWCVLDAEWHRLLDEATEEASRLLGDARAGAVAEAARIVDDAHAEAATVLLEAQERADRILAEARLSAMAPPAPVEDPTGIREALQRLRSELSHVVDAALDAFPAIEATAELFAEPAPPEPEAVIDLTDDDPVVDVVAVAPDRPGRFRRLLRLAR
jgi:vacuolar-type H+-ATPase subunit H